jgi:hypothetical protein
MGKASRRKRERREPQRHLELTATQRDELLRTVRDDLDFLGRMDYQQPSLTMVRVASSILRRLLHDGLYGAAWTVADLSGEPKVVATDLESALAPIPRRYISYAYAGGAGTDGAKHDGLILLVVPKAEAESEGYAAAAERIGNLMGPLGEREYALSDYVRSASAVAGNSSIGRLEIIRYVANKLGGVHWDNSRSTWTDPLGSRYLFLDEQHMYVGNLAAPHYEILSIAQAITSSPDTRVFVETVDRIAPVEDRPPHVLSFRQGRGGRYSEMTFTPKTPKQGQLDD